MRKALFVIFILITGTCIAQREYLDSMLKVHSAGNNFVLKKRIEEFKRSAAFRNDYFTYSL
jgi:hypothetical protein